MAERSFKKEVQKLKLGAGDIFRGEGILAITKALLESGVGYVGGYQGAPISHLMDVLADAEDILAEYGVRFDSSASEAAAAASLSASVNYPIRGAVTFKATVGTNVASDALANLSSGGVTGGALIIVGEDYGEGSSIMQERSHAFAMKSQMWLLDPRPNLPCIVKAVKDGFELSEASHTPVMLQVGIRSCHQHGEFIAADNQRPPLSIRDAMEHPNRDVDRIVLPPASFEHEKQKVEQRWPAAVRFIQERQLNEFFAEDAADVGIVLQGGRYNTVIRALQRLGLANVYGDSKIPLYVMNVTYPLIDDEFQRFCSGKRAVLVLEEGQPNFIEQNVALILHRLGLDTRLHGKDLLPMAGEYDAAVTLDGVHAFLSQYGWSLPSFQPKLIVDPDRDETASAITSQVRAFQRNRRGKDAAPKGGAGTAAAPAHESADAVATEEPPAISAEEASQHAASILARASQSAATSVQQGHKPGSQAQPAGSNEGQLPELKDIVYPRPPGLCTGCPERPIFSSLKLVQRELGQHHISADIGCNLFSILPPFHLGNTTMGYGLGAASASAFNVAHGAEYAERRAIAIMGDGGFWHNGLTSGVANAVFNKSDNVTIIVDNDYTAATGGQDLISSIKHRVNPHRDAAHAIEDAAKGVGVKWIRTIRRTYDVNGMMGVMREALTTAYRGPKLIIAQSECMLNKERREKPLRRKAIAAGERVVRVRFGVDPDVCTGDHECIRLSGCPSLAIKENPDPLRETPVTVVEDSCVGCGHCGEVADAAILCPSFYKVGIINNETAWDRFKHAVPQAIIGWLQRRQAKRQARYAF